jgi:hypothetical protein
MSKKAGEKVLGTIQMTGDVLMSIANLSEMEVQVDVSENDVTKVHVGDSANVEVDAYNNRIFKGVVTKIASSSSAATAATTASGDVTHSDRTISVDPITVLVKLCANDLHGVSVEQFLPRGSNAETQTIPNEALIVDYFLRKHRAQLEQNIWKGNKSTGSGNLALSNGFIANIGAGVVDINTNGYTTLDSNNAYDVFFKMYEDMNQEVIEDGAQFFVGREFYNALAKNMVDLNFFTPYESAQLASNPSMILAGTDIRINRVAGLNSSNLAYIAKPMDLVVGTDLRNDFEEVTSWYEKKDDAMYIRVKFKIGTQVPYVDQIGKFELAAS